VQPRAGAGVASDSAPRPGEIVAVDGDAVRVAPGREFSTCSKCSCRANSAFRAVDLVRGRVLRSAIVARHIEAWSRHASPSRPLRPTSDAKWRS
jgi:hypothetical protein